MSSFPQLRKDPIVDRWVLIAPERAGRPFDLAEASRARVAGPCPFCEGEEQRTPPEVFAIRRAGTRPDEPGWSVRVVPNIFPAVRGDAHSMSGEQPFRIWPGYGVHEVVIESPRHETSLPVLSPELVRRTFGVYRSRLAELAGDKKLLYVQVFKNHGPAAGASVEHVHSQILGVPRVPREISAELTGTRSFHVRTNQCVYCNLLERETTIGKRVIAVNKYVVALAAFAGRFPYETWILPRKHGSDFHTASNAEISETADLIRVLLARLDRLVENVSYNLVLHTAPLHGGPRPDYHWHWELLPRTTGIAGFELASGWFINPLPPEIAAERLRG